MRIRYEGKVRGFRQYALPALRKAAMRGMSIQDDSRQVQRGLRKAEMRDIRDQVLRGPGPAA
ncbi:MAG: hypothetical protein PHO72_02365 [Sphaerochaeta sp.]|nr:hypothetical protein [Sphaerochaeta sp.]